ncbi:hypothetical protein E2C01_055666 [Portunus trituberculatus]|uniref:Uncharacterized protein n=1 Tax=Portunus trituberculatus TaxID=210409 RepID=A0A5B7GRV4_PORTR|nr:hypothetical protein [Portunus trituberculatus]
MSETAAFKKRTMAPKRLISGENKESSESASVSEPEITPDIFMDDDSSSDDLPPPPHPSSLLLYIFYHQFSLTPGLKVALRGMVEATWRQEVEWRSMACLDNSWGKTDAEETMHSLWIISSARFSK